MTGGILRNRRNRRRISRGLDSIIAAASAAVLVLALWSASGCRRAAPANPIEVPEGVDHTEWNRLLHAYVDDQGLVDYGRWKASESDVRALSDYLTQLAPPVKRPAVGTERAASLVNAYNAFTVQWILANYPTESIQALPNSFGGARYRIGGQDVSLDAIEHTLRPEVGFRVHAALVCAARSCPPLAREAYRPDRFVSQISYGMLRWLARDDLNHFDPDRRRAEISPIFKSYGEDFEAARGGLRGVLSTFAPDRARLSVSEATTSISYKDYDWGLNDQGPHGRNYRRGLWKRLKGLFSK